MKEKSNFPEEKNYNLKSKAVEDLVSDEVPEYSKEELEKYRKKRFRIPNVVKIIFLKAWFFGAVCYFILWGLGMYLPDLEQIVVLGLVLGMVTDLLLNNVIRFLESFPGENKNWMFVNRKKTGGLVLNVLYGCVIIWCVYSTYTGVNEFLNIAYDTEGVIYLGVEPLLFGLFAMGYDLAFLAVKRLFGRILSDAMQSARTR